MELSSDKARIIAGSLNYRFEGLVIAVAQDAKSSAVLMVAFMNPQAVEKTLTTGLAHYFSTERRRLWLKGEESGHYQHVEDFYVDCDKDTVLLRVRQAVGACHLGYGSCFFRKLRWGRLESILPKVFSPKKVYGETA